ncbi:MAG: hypothetical protein M3O71_08265 [Bacteroidota bacterium]|nr:hypothetical protein [Bacteroidota bacterium]
MTTMANKKKLIAYLADADNSKAIYTLFENDISHDEISLIDEQFER